MAEENKNVNDKEIESKKMNFQNPELKFPKWITEGIIIATIPVLAYFLSWLYNLAYFRYFGIPYELITVELGTIILTVFLIIYLAIIFNLIIFLMALALSRILYRMFRLKTYIGYICLCAMMVFLIIQYISLGEIHFAIMTAAGFLVFLGFSLFIYKINNEDNSHKKRILVPISILLMIIGSCGFISTFAYYTARKNIIFRIYESNPEMVVLQLYSNRLICSEFNRENKTVDSTYVIIDIANSSPVRLHEENVGPLKPIKKFLEEKKTEKKEDNN